MIYVAVVCVVLGTLAMAILIYVVKMEIDADFNPTRDKLERYNRDK